MHPTASSPRDRGVLTWVVTVAGAALLVVLFLSFFADTGSRTSGEHAAASPAHLAYLEFQRTQDVLVLVDPDKPSERRELLSVPHAPDYGLVPAIAPDGARFAFTALPPELTSPTPQSPAGLWVVAIEKDAEPALLADGVDLLVAPVWTQDGSSVVFRRSSPQGYVLSQVAAAGGEEHELVRSENSALFPVGFSPDGRAFYYVSLEAGSGSGLHFLNLETGDGMDVAHLSKGLTRDWVLSPHGDRLAFLAIDYSPQTMVSQAFLLDINTGGLEPLSENAQIAFGPAWSRSGALVVGAFDEGSRSAVLLLYENGGSRSIEGPNTGFDVPVSFTPTASAYVVRSFENDSVMSPGRSTLMLTGADAARQTLATGEVTFVGWTNP